MVVQPGTHALLPGAKERLKDLAQQGQVWFFSCWAFNDTDINFLNGLEIPFGILQKPYANEYVVLDDKLLVQECGTSLAVRACEFPQCPNLGIWRNYCPCGGQHPAAICDTHFQQVTSKKV